MPETEVKTPDGTVITVRHPEGATDQQILSYARQQSAGQIAPAQERGRGFFDELQNPNPTTKYGMVFPVARDQGGEKEWGRPSMLMQEAYRAFTAPTRALKGEMQPEQMQDEAFNLATMAGSGTLARAAAPALAREGVKVGAEAIGSPAVAETVAAAAKAGKAVGNMTGATRFYESVIERLPSNVDKAAARRLAQRLDQDGLTVDEIGRELQWLGKYGTIADAGGRNIQSQTRKLIQEPGETGQLAEKVLDPRQASQGSRVVDSVQRNISGRDFYGDIDTLTRRQQTKASPLYKRAYRENQNVTNPWLRNALDQDPDIMRGIKAGHLELQRQATIRGEKYNPAEYGIIDFTEAGDPILGQETPLSLWHAARIGLDKEIEKFRNPLTGKVEGAGSLIDLRKSLDEQLKAVTGGAKGAFARADEVYAGPAKIKDAMWMGRRFAKGDEEITEKVFKGMTPTEQDAFRTGVAREMVAMIRKKGVTPPALKDALKDTAIADKIKIFAPTPEKYNRFINTLQREARFSQTNALRGGSQTGSLVAEGADMGMDFGGAIIAGASGRPLSAASSALNAAFTWLQRASMPQPVRDRMGEMLLSQDPAVQRQALDMIREMQTPKPRQLTSSGSRSPSITGGRNQTP